MGVCGTYARHSAAYAAPNLTPVAAESKIKTAGLFNCAPMLATDVGHHARVPHAFLSANYDSSALCGVKFGCSSCFGRDILTESWIICAPSAMIIHAGSSVCGGGGPTFDYLGTRTWIIWHHLPDLSNSLRSGRCHSGLSRVRARISRAGRAAGRWGRVRLRATHRPRPEAGPCGLPPYCIDRCVHHAGARWCAQAGGGRAIFRGAAQKA